MARVHCARTKTSDVAKAGELQEPCGALRRRAALSSVLNDANKCSQYDLEHNASCVLSTLA